MSFWTPEEVRLLRQLGFDPQRNPPEKLAGLGHFQSGGSLWAVTEGSGEPHVSKDLGKNVRRYVQTRELDWVIQREIPLGEAVIADTPREILVGQLREHLDSLVEVIRSLRGVEPLTLGGQQILPWWLRTQEPCWPIAKGRVCRGEAGLSVHLQAEDELEWQYLKQHLAGDELWDAIEAWKLAMAQDIRARLGLLDELARRVREAIDLPLVEELREPENRINYVYPYYVHLLYDQVFAQALGNQVSPKTRAQFEVREGGRVNLSSFLILRSDNVARVEDAIEFFLDAQTSLSSLEATRDAAALYRNAEAITQDLKLHLRRILLAPGLPPGTYCEGCRDRLRSGDR